MGGKMELFPSYGSPWGIKEDRKRLFLEAAKAFNEGNLEPLLEGLEIFLRAIRQQSPITTREELNQLRRFLAFIRTLRQELRFLPGDFARYRDELYARNVSRDTVRRYSRSAKNLLRFCDWVGVNIGSFEIPYIEAAVRRHQPLSLEMYREVLRQLEGYSSSWRPTIQAICVICGEGGYAVREALKLKLSDYDKGKLRLPGGKISISPTGKRVLEHYLIWREDVKSYPTDRLVLSPKGAPPLPSTAYRAITHFAERFELPVCGTVLRLSGQQRLYEHFGKRQALKLLGRVTSF